MASDLPITLTSTVIAYYRNHAVFSRADKFAERVALREHYSDGWTKGKPGLTIRPDGGQADRFTAQMRGRLECRIYASDPELCDGLFGLLEQDLQAFDRTLVNHEAVLQYLVLEGSPNYLHDPDTNLPMYLFFITAAVRTESALAEA